MDVFSFFIFMFWRVWDSSEKRTTRKQGWRSCRIWKNRPGEVTRHRIVTETNKINSGDDAMTMLPYYLFFSSSFKKNIYFSTSIIAVLCSAMHLKTKTYKHSYSYAIFSNKPVIATLIFILLEISISFTQFFYFELSFTKKKWLREEKNLMKEEKIFKTTMEGTEVGWLTSL